MSVNAINKLSVGKMPSLNWLMLFSKLTFFNSTICYEVSKVDEAFSKSKFKCSLVNSFCNWV